MRTITRSRAISLLMCLLLALLGSGCDERAQEFARKTAAILEQRSNELSRKIAAETKAFNAAAAAASDAHRDLIDSTLLNERNGRSIALAADYDEGRKPISKWRSDLAEYAQVDYTLNRDLLAADIDAGSLFLQKLHALQIEQDKVDALSKLLAALAKKPTLAADIQAVTQFAEDTKAEFDKKVCAELARDTSPAGKAASKAKGCKT
jgi:hypothetical protein